MDDDHNGQDAAHDIAPGIAKVLKRLHHPLDVILLCVRWHAAYSLSLRNLGAMTAERGLAVDHSSVHRWVIKLAPLFEKSVSNGEPQAITVDNATGLSEAGSTIDVAAWSLLVDPRRHTVNILGITQAAPSCDARDRLAPGRVVPREP
ncbi:hypothetical protein LMG27177_04049 [Paraburkholderia fynbosensis]|uniref:IS6 family transposase ISBmu21 n=1 Tax=Paraburkholderia fynbosensis TaxID=1200993 RepID=A0A6J5GC72_9BURK|nr:hypothetical protein LMG27177_04049 [Paraburkholderia fynbosensis]